VSAPTTERIQDEIDVSILFCEEAANDLALAGCMRDRGTRLAAAVIQRRAYDLMALCLGRSTGKDSLSLGAACEHWVWVGSFGSSSVLNKAKVSV